MHVIENEDGEIMMLCSNCFLNEGLRIEAERLGQDDDSACEHCGSVSGHKLSKDQIEELLDNFFVHGSVPQNIGGYASVYRISDDLSRESVSFAEPLQSDYNLIKNALGRVLFEYGPPLWRLGYTEHYWALMEALKKASEAEQLLEAQSTLDEIVGRCNVLTLPAGTKLYRVRANLDGDPNSASEYDTVPAAFKTTVDRCARFDTPTFPVFYAAPDIETCLHECRVTAADEICLATMRTTTELRLLNIGDDFKQPDGSTPFERVEITLNKLCTTNKNEYPKCRLLSQAIRSAGYQGFRFKSYFSIVKKEPLFNIALFGYPVAQSELKLESVNRVKLEVIDYEYSFGPTFKPS